MYYMHRYTIMSITETLPCILFKILFALCTAEIQDNRHMCLLPIDRADGSGPAAPVLAGPVFLKVKVKFHFYKKQVKTRSTGVIFGFLRLTILRYNRQKKHIKRSKVIGRPCIQLIVMLTRHSVV